MIGAAREATAILLAGVACAVLMQHCSPSLEAAVIHDDQAVMPYTGAACAIAEAVSADDPIVRLVCVAVEDVEAIVSKLPVPEAGAAPMPARVQLPPGTPFVLHVPAAQLPSVLARVRLVPSVAVTAARLDASTSAAQGVVDAMGGQ
jgi:hypothetical protein